MTSSFHIELVYICKLGFVVGLYAGSLPEGLDPAKFSFSSLLDSVLPSKSLQGADKCETFKSLFGLTYEQMQEKNSTNFHEALEIDLITRNGNIKQNLTVNRRLSRTMANASTIVILVHGFMESSDGIMVNGLSPGLLKQQDIRVLALDGRKLINLEYFRSSTYARFMGERLGIFLGDMVKSGQDPSKMILIGHSLGAHIAGIAGKWVHQVTNQTVGRLIALDPAAPCFGNVSAGGRLGHDDAEYVMVVHTNGGMLGLSEPVGDTDWFPNGGSSQPGCILSTCSHSRAWELLAAAIAMPHRFPARKCENWTMFQSGQCAKNEVAYLGLNSDRPSPGNYFFATASSPPYGLGVAGSG